LAGLQCGEVEVVPDSGEGRQRLGRDRVEELAWVSEVLGEAPPHLEVELPLLPAGDAAVHGLDVRLQPLPVYERARIELRQNLRQGHLISRGTGLGTHRYLLHVAGLRVALDTRAV
jgi:hypothetical protein